MIISTQMIIVIISAQMINVTILTKDNVMIQIVKAINVIVLSKVKCDNSSHTSDKCDNPDSSSPHSIIRSRMRYIIIYHHNGCTTTMRWLWEVPALPTITAQLCFSQYVLQWNHCSLTNSEAENIFLKKKFWIFLSCTYLNI